MSIDIEFRFYYALCFVYRTLEVACCTHFTDNGFNALARVSAIHVLTKVSATLTRVSATLVRVSAIHVLTKVSAKLVGVSLYISQVKCPPILA